MRISFFPANWRRCFIGRLLSWKGLQGNFTACPSQAFPLGGRWLAEGQTDEGAMIVLLPLSQGEFRRPGGE